MITPEDVADGLTVRPRMAPPVPPPGRHGRLRRHANLNKRLRVDDQGRRGGDRGRHQSPAVAPCRPRVALAA